MVAVTPLAGDYLQDGQRMVEILGVDADGHYMAEDVVTEGIVTIPPEALSDWVAVQRD